MKSDAQDNLATIAAVGLLAYVCADMTHHALGHATACRLLGGQVLSLSSIYVSCSQTGAAIDVAGPLANAVVGTLALLIGYALTPGASTARLFWVLAAAFNLFWFGALLAQSAATQTDDWAWALQTLHATTAARYGVVAVGAGVYVVAVRLIARAAAPFAWSRGRARTVTLTAWLAAGAIACVTAAYDPHPAAAILHHAAPQSLLVSLGLLLVPGRMAQDSSSPIDAAVVRRSIPWIAAALIVGAMSVAWLGPGIAAR